MKKEKVIQVVRVEAGKTPEVLFIKNELETLQNIVGGYIEALSIEDGVCIICNEEGKINGLELNRALKNDMGNIWEIIAGTFLIAGDNYESGEFVSLTDEQADFYKFKFYFPEVFFKTDDNEIRVVKVPPIE